MIKNIVIIYRTFTLQIKNSFVRPTFQFCIIAQPIIYSFIIYMMFQDSNQDNFASFVFLGTGILTLWSSICFSSAGSIERERYMGTLQVVYSTPTNFKLIMMGKVIANTALGIIPFGISFLVIRFGFNSHISIQNIGAFCVSLCLALLSFLGIALILACFFALTRSARILRNCLEYPIYILCGVIFPIEVLPTWLHPVSYILSPTWATRVLRMSIDGITDYRSYYQDMIILLTITCIYFIIAYLLFDIINNKIRIHATMEVS